jgi:auxin-responsive protein IAA
MPPPPLEARDYIGLGAAASSSSSSSCCSGGGEGAVGPHLALRLGLPGSESPGRAAGPEHVDAALTLGPAPPRGGAKRGFADSLDLPAKQDADAAGDAAGGVRGEEKGVAEAAAGAPRTAK